MIRYDCGGGGHSRTDPDLVPFSVVSMVFLSSLSFDYICRITCGSYLASHIGVKKLRDALHMMAAVTYIHNDYAY